MFDSCVGACTPQTPGRLDTSALTSTLGNSPARLRSLKQRLLNRHPNTINPTLPLDAQMTRLHDAAIVAHNLGHLAHIVDQPHALAHQRQRQVQHVRDKALDVHLDAAEKGLNMLSVGKQAAHSVLLCIEKLKEKLAR